MSISDEAYLRQLDCREEYPDDNDTTERRDCRKKKAELKHKDRMEQGRIKRCKNKGKKWEDGECVEKNKGGKRKTRRKRTKRKKSKRKIKRRRTKSRRKLNTRRRKFKRKKSNRKKSKRKRRR